MDAKSQHLLLVWTGSCLFQLKMEGKNRKPSEKSKDDQWNVKLFQPPILPDVAGDYGRDILGTLPHM